MKTVSDLLPKSAYHIGNHSGEYCQLDGEMWNSSRSNSFHVKMTQLTRKAKIFMTDARASIYLGILLKPENRDHDF